MKFLFPYLDQISNFLFGLYFTNLLVAKYGIESIGDFIFGLTVGGFSLIFLNLGFPIILTKSLAASREKFKYSWAGFLYFLPVQVILTVMIAMNFKSTTTSVAIIIAYFINLKGLIAGLNLIIHDNFLVFIMNLLMRILLLTLLSAEISIGLTLYSHIYILILLVIIVLFVLTGDIYHTQIKKYSNSKQRKIMLLRSSAILPIPIIEFIFIRGELLLLPYFISSEKYSQFSLAISVYFAMLLPYLIINKQIFTKLARFKKHKKELILFLLISFISSLLIPILFYFEVIKQMLEIFRLNSFLPVYDEITLLSSIIPVASITITLRYFLQSQKNFRNLSAALGTICAIKLFVMAFFIIEPLDAIYVILLGEILLLLTLSILSANLFKRI